jgi:uncharacterized Ntn-hydrolase superfamily protein
MSRPAVSRRPVATYSIVAGDATGAFGVAVQSHWFNVGAVVPWVAAGVGAIAVQSISDPGTGERAVGLLQEGAAAGEVLERILEGDRDAAYRQIAVVDGDGRVAAHTGGLCIAEAGHVTGAGFSAQANLMDGAGVWPAMADAFARAEGDLAGRLLVALEAGEAAGGDVRGRQSAALVVLSPEGVGGSRFDLRVEDARDPVGELRRLVSLQRAYLELNRGDAMMSKGDHGEALSAYEAAATMIPDDATNGEAPFWAGVALAAVGRVDEAVPYIRRAAAFGDRWARLLPRLVRSNMLPDDDELVARLLDAARR